MTPKPRPSKSATGANGALRAYVAMRTEGKAGQYGVWWFGDNAGAS
jgi:hypothetical protein